MTGKQPIIVIGMHRSGTSLVSRLLDQSGVFPGALKDHNHEALFFQVINDWILGQAGSSWDLPAPFARLLDDPDVRPLVVGQMETLLRRPWVAAYLGLAGYLRRRSLLEMERCWGWKDPRNTVTLPVWLDVFPGAKVVHVRRHGVAVARSLRRRRAKTLAAGRDRRIGPLGLAIPRLGRVVDSLRCGTLEGGFSLWEDYMTLARSHAAGLGSASFELRYEDLLEDPEHWLRQLCSFCEVSPSKDAIARAVAQVITGRPDSDLEDSGARRFASSVGDRLAEFGY